MAEQKLHAAQVGAMFHHVRGATVSQRVRAGGAVGKFHQVPDPLPGQRHAAQRQKHARGLAARRLAFARRADTGEVGAPFGQIGFERFERGSPQGHDALLVALAAHLHTACIESQVAGVERGEFGNPQSSGVKQFQNGPVTKGRRPRLRMVGSHRRPLQHFRNLRLRKGLGQHSPGLGRLDVDGRIVADPPVEQKPLVKPAQAA